MDDTTVRTRGQLVHGETARPIDWGFRITGEDVEEVSNEDTGYVSSSEESERENG
jgi:hypothetical protein